ncbi:MAG: molybdenum cofactor guanylyltransferase [Acidimicrobiales bacterium]
MKPSTPAVHGLLLTGGSSRRMGFDKASMLIDGVTCAARAAAALSAVTDVALEVGPGGSGLPTVAEAEPGLGPLVALSEGRRALLGRGATGDVLLLACDLPLVTPQALALIARHPSTSSVVPVFEGRPQPLCARWSTAHLAELDEMVEGGARSMRGLLALPGIVWLEDASWGNCLADVDCPTDLARLGVAWAAPRSPHGHR